MSPKSLNYPDPESSTAKLDLSTEKSPLPDSSLSIEDKSIPTVIDNSSVNHLETLTSVLPIFESHGFSFTI